MEREGYRAIVTGPGRMGSYHLRVLNMLPGVRVAAVVDTSAERHADAQHVYGDISTLDDPSRALAEIEGVEHRRWTSSPSRSWLAQSSTGPWR
jgi:threonine dehydrogenase-like Zn-dependent dehydrogenase